MSLLGFRHGSTHHAYSLTCHSPDNLQIMGTGNEQDDSVAVPWLHGFAAMESEFFIRVHSVIDLCAGLHHLAEATTRYLNEHDKLSAASVAGRSLSATLVAEDLRDQVGGQFAGFMGEFGQRVRGHLDQLDPAAIVGQTSPAPCRAARSTANARPAAFPSEASRRVLAPILFPKAFPSPAAIEHRAA